MATHIRVVPFHLRPKEEQPTEAPSSPPVEISPGTNGKMNAPLPTAEIVPHTNGKMMNAPSPTVELAPDSNGKLKTPVPSPFDMSRHTQHVRKQLPKPLPSRDLAETQEVSPEELAELQAVASESHQEELRAVEEESGQSTLYQGATFCDCFYYLWCCVSLVCICCFGWCTRKLDRK